MDRDHLLRRSKWIESRKILRQKQYNDQYKYLHMYDNDTHIQKRKKIQTHMYDIIKDEYEPIN